MISKIFLVAAVVAYVEARFGQEQIPIPAISAVKGGAPGEAQTIAGGAVSNLLGAANSCDKLVTADKIVAQLGTGADAIAAAIGMVTAEKNTNPFANNNTQNVCGDASLPATPELRGITPLIDPAVDVDGKVAALSKSSAAKPLSADGMSIFDLLNAAGFGDLVKAQQPAASAAAAAASVSAAPAAASNSSASEAVPAAACTAAAAASVAAAPAAASTGSAQTAATNGTAAASTLTGGEDFGKCTPTIKFEAGQNGRAATEFTFQITDPLARGGQQDALNPNIITNALCNQLINVCDANAAAETACLAAKAKVAAAGTRDKSTADLFNAAVGFAGAVTNPDGGPADRPAARMMRRGLRV